MSDILIYSIVGLTLIVFLSSIGYLLWSMQRQRRTEQEEKRRREERQRLLDERDRIGQQIYDQLWLLIARHGYRFSIYGLDSGSYFAVGVSLEDQLVLRVEVCTGLLVILERPGAAPHSWSDVREPEIESLLATAAEIMAAADSAPHPAR